MPGFEAKEHRVSLPARARIGGRWIASIALGGLLILALVSSVAAQHSAAQQPSIWLDNQGRPLERLSLPATSGQVPAATNAETGSLTPTHQVRALPAPPAQMQNGNALTATRPQQPPVLHQQPSARQLLRVYPAAVQNLLDDEDTLLDDSPDASLDADPLEAMGPAAGTSIRSPGGSQNIPGAGHGKDSATRSDLPDGLDPHAEAFAEDCYPSATKCAPCHRKIYDEWRVSAHAYSAVSPMFHKFEQKITELSQGTIGTFCMRCHAPVATQMNFPRHASILDGPLVFREGVTCVACHRVAERYGRVQGERRIEPGPLQAPVLGGIGGDGVAKAIADKSNYKIKVDPNDKKPGQEIHLQGIKFEQLTSSAFCQPCHQVAVHPGIALEVVWAQYRASPACKKGISCQDCHMGKVPGKPQGYSYGPAANMSGKAVNMNRKHSNHMFFGPGNPIAHPGIFPFNEKSLRWTAEQWLQFDWRAGWGADQFEKALAAEKIQANFPEVWDSTDERRDARKVLDDNFKLLDIKKASSIAVMEAGLRVEGPYFRKSPRVGQDLHMHFTVDNQSEGHNSPSGSLGAQPQLWLNVVLTAPNGQRVWESGYLDRNGDLANQHSLEVTQGFIPPDRQLFNLQTQFITTGVKGPDREMYLPVNVDIDQLPFLRPGAIPVSVLNHPPFIRMEQKSIPPLGRKIARYRIPGELLCQPGDYRVSVRMRSRMEPIYFMRFCGATSEMERRMLEQTIDLHPYAKRFTIR